MNVCMWEEEQDDVYCMLMVIIFLIFIYFLKEKIRKRTYISKFNTFEQRSELTMGKLLINQYIPNQHL